MSSNNSISHKGNEGEINSHDDHSADEICDCDSIEGVRSRLTLSMTNNGAGMTDELSGTDHPNNIAMGHHHQFPGNHPLNALGNFMGIGSLQTIPNLQHNDMLEKLKTQVRDMKVGLMDQEYAAAHAAAFGSNVLSTPINASFTLPNTTMASFTHAAQSLVAKAGNSSLTSMGGPLVSNGSHNTFSFTSPSVPSSKDVNPASNSSASSETSNSSQQNNGWSFEEQYKQVRQGQQQTNIMYKGSELSSTIPSTSGTQDAASNGRDYKNNKY